MQALECKVVIDEMRVGDPCSGVAVGGRCGGQEGRGEGQIGEGVLFILT